MAVEAWPFLQKLELLSRKRIKKATYRTAFFEGARVMVVRCGIGPSRASASIQNLEQRPSWIVAVGTAGALVDSLKVGDVVVSSTTVCQEKDAAPYESNPDMISLVCRACQMAGANYRVGKIASAAKPVFAREDREKLQRSTDAVAVDMESYWIAHEADRLTVPFVAVRVISDDMNAPPLPEYTGPTALLRSPLQFFTRLPQYMSWRAFLRDFKAAIDILPPVLVELLRSCMR